MNSTSSRKDGGQSLSIARQPIFDKKQRLWGYSLLCVGSDGPVCSGLWELDTIGANLAGSAFIGLKQMTEKGIKLMVDYTDKNLLDFVPYALPSEMAAVAVSQDICLNPEVLEALQQLRQDRYTLIIRDFSADTKYYAAYDLAHILAVDAVSTPFAMLSKVVSAARSRNVSLMVTQLENHHIFKQYDSLGFDFFHGPFFKTADGLILRKLSINEVSRFNLLRLMEEPEPDIPKIVESLQADATLSFRLLSYLNSVAFGFRQKIKSIQQAVTLLGWRKLKNWLRVVLMGELNQSKHASALMFMAAQRGKFLESLASLNDYWGFDPDTLHLLGMFSLLDAMLQIPIGEIVEHLPIEDKIRDALLGKPNNEYLPLLQLARALEDVKWDAVEPLASQLNLKIGNVAAAFQTSVEWAIEWLEVENSSEEP